MTEASYCGSCREAAAGRRVRRGILVPRKQTLRRGRGVNDERSKNASEEYAR